MIVYIAFSCGRKYGTFMFVFHNELKKNKEMQFKLTNPDLIKKSFLCYKKGVLFTMLSASQNTKRMKESKQYLTDHASDLDCQCSKWA